MRTGSEPYERLSALLAHRQGALLARAVLLAGSRAGGEDLLQAALERVLRNWRRVQGDPEPLLRTVMYRLAVDAHRYRGRRPEVLAVVEAPGPDPCDGVLVRHALVQALGCLPPRQRAVLVLRYLDDLSEAQTAATLGCSVGNVKSTAARALARLREQHAEWSPQSTADVEGSVRR